MLRLELAPSCCIEEEGASGAEPHAPCSVSSSRQRDLASRLPLAAGRHGGRRSIRRLFGAAVAIVVRVVLAPRAS